MVETLSGKAIRLARREGYQDHQRALEYPTSRGLSNRNSGEKADGYLELLLGFDEKNLVGLIEEKIATNGQVRILDIGCGQGRFLIDCKYRWKDKVECTGISAYPYHLRTEYPGAWRTSELLDELGIEIQIADAQNFSRHPELEPRHFDIVTAVKIAEYLPDPMAMLKEIHKSLKIGGVGLIDNFSLRASYEDAKSVIHFLQSQYGFQCKYNIYMWDCLYVDVAFQKTQKRLTLPISYARLVDRSILVGSDSAFDGTFCIYKYNPPKISL